MLLERGRLLGWVLNSLPSALQRKDALDTRPHAWTMLSWLLAGQPLACIHAGLVCFEPLRTYRPEPTSPSLSSLLTPIPPTREDTLEISAAMQNLGIVISKDDPEIRASMAYGMFDTRGSVRT